MLRGLRVSLLVAGGASLSWCIGLNALNIYDFVALKFDVDNDSLGPTMEWGFLADLLRRPEALALVDELFIELHFFAPSLNWVHLTHSMKQAFDVLRQLRACGLPVHAWP